MTAVAMLSCKPKHCMLASEQRLKLRLLSSCVCVCVCVSQGAGAKPQGDIEYIVLLSPDDDKQAHKDTDADKDADKDSAEKDKEQDTADKQVRHSRTHTHTHTHTSPVLVDWPGLHGPAQDGPVTRCVRRMHPRSRGLTGCVFVSWSHTQDAAKANNKNNAVLQCITNVLSQKQEGFTCSICMDRAEETTSTPCG